MSRIKQNPFATSVGQAMHCSATHQLFKLTEALIRPQSLCGLILAYIGPKGHNAGFCLMQLIHVYAGVLSSSTKFQ